DGTHYTKEGKERLAEAVTDCVVRHLAVRSVKPAAKAPDAEAAKKYKKAEADRDAQVPDYFKKLKVGKFEPPAAPDAWKAQRRKVRDVVGKSLGEIPYRPKPSAHLISREIPPHFALEGLTIPNGLDGEMTAYFFAPPGGKHKGKRPAVMWLHSSSYDRNQLLWRGYNGGDEPPGETYAKAGYAGLAPDAAWYGRAAGQRARQAAL